MSFWSWRHSLTFYSDVNYYESRGGGITVIRTRTRLATLASADEHWQREKHG